MNLNTGNLSERSEKAAIKTLLEISQKENLYENTHTDSEVNSWIRKNPLGIIKNNCPNQIKQRPSTALGKPPRVNKVIIRHSIYKNETSSSDHKHVLLPVVSPIPPAHNILMNFIKPPIPNKLKLRSKSLKEEENHKKLSESIHIIKDINLNFRRNMVKYKLYKEYSINESSEGLKLINMPRSILH